jgi:hypothetical protein
MSNDNHGMRIKNHVIVPSRWVCKTVRMILMTAVMVSLFTSAAILTQNGNGNVAFAKKATTATKDTGTATKTTHTVDTGTPKKSSKDTSGSGSSSSSTTSSSSSTSTSGSGSTTDNGAVKTNGVTNTALPPDHVVDPNHVFYDKCKPGQHLDPVTHACVKDESSPHQHNPACHISGSGNTGCHCPRNAACPIPTPNPNPNPKPCNISSGGVVSTASCHCQTKAKCPLPVPKPPEPSSVYMKKYNAGWNQACGDDMKHTNFIKTGPHSKAWTDGYFDAIQSDGPCP